jgi:hypothetical protein
MTYQDYISSSSWRNSGARLGELAAALFRCRICNDLAFAGQPLEVHHRTYERFTCELVTDLTTLCGECHRGVTSLLRGRRYATRRPLVTNVIPAISRPSALFDPSCAGARS